MDETLLYSLLAGSLISSSALVVMSAAIVGRKIADLEYQKALGINGVRQIQSIVNIRTHILRVAVGSTFIIISLLLMAEAPVIIRTWVNRILFVLLPLSYAMASVLDWRAERKQIALQIAMDEQAHVDAILLAKAAEAQRAASLAADRDSYKDMAAEAIASLSIMSTRIRSQRGDTPIEPLAAVVPEHSSPVTLEQQGDADRQTLRAKLTASTLDLGLPTRTSEPQSPKSTVVTPESVDVVTIQEGALEQITDAIRDTTGHAP